MPQYAIVIFPTFEELSLIQQFRVKYDPLADVIKPHITLVFPFESNLSAEQLQAHTRQAIQGIGPFQVQLKGITGSDGEYLFLNVKRGNDQLIELHDRLYSGTLAKQLSAEHTYIPHLTVGRLNQPDAFLGVLEQARKISAVFETLVDQVSVCQLDHLPSIEFTVNL